MLVVSTSKMKGKRRVMSGDVDMNDSRCYNSLSTYGRRLQHYYQTDELVTAGVQASVWTPASFFQIPLALGLVTPVYFGRRVVGPTKQTRMVDSPGIEPGALDPKSKAPRQTLSVTKGMLGRLISPHERLISCWLRLAWSFGPITRTATLLFQNLLALSYLTSYY